MFRDNPDLAPISMIITNLAARAYEGETDIGVALWNIVEKMPTFIRPTWPRVPNPADPAEDYADKWAQNPQLEKSFWDWHTEVKVVLAKLPTFLRGGSLKTDVEDLFDVRLADDDVRRLETGNSRAPAIVRAAPILTIPAAPKPWGRNA
jgi:hypothetical protein